MGITFIVQVAKTRLRHAPGGKSYVSDDTGQECVFTKFIA